MAKFKEGDRVKVVCSMAAGEVDTTPGAIGTYGMYKVGDIGTVLCEEEMDYKVQMDEECRMAGSRIDLLVNANELARLTLHPVEMMLG